MTSESEGRISALKAQIEKARQMGYRSGARLEELQGQQKRLMAELAALQVSPADLADQIHQLRSEVDGLLERAATLLPDDRSRG